ncbi:MAG TPA: class I SAM-dependent methyltransferase [Anaerolineales bacterium]|nr:class I SAM-dependent methyltransferase [Anaerolineales bacterium]
MIEKTLPASTAQRFYDRLGRWYELADFYGGRAKSRALQQLALVSGLRILHVGVGTGRDHAQLCAAVAPNGQAIGIDLSPIMLRLTRDRTFAPVCVADACSLPFADHAFDRLFAAYVLDLIPVADLPPLLNDFQRVLRSDGSMVLVTLTEGATFRSRLFVSAWKGLYRLSPIACGGCRPLQLAGLVTAAGFTNVKAEVMVQMGIPSEIVTASRK